jgi:hypothetical protein
LRAHCLLRGMGSGRSTLDSPGDPEEGAWPIESPADWLLAGDGAWCLRAPPRRSGTAGLAGSTRWVHWWSRAPGQTCTCRSIEEGRFADARGCAGSPAHADSGTAPGNTSAFLARATRWHLRHADSPGIAAPRCRGGPSVGQLGGISSAPRLSRLGRISSAPQLSRCGPAPSPPALGTRWLDGASPGQAGPRKGAGSTGSARLPARCAWPTCPADVSRADQSGNDLDVWRTCWSGHESLRQ